MEPKDAVLDVNVLAGTSLSRTLAWSHKTTEMPRGINIISVLPSGSECLGAYPTDRRSSAGCNYHIVLHEGRHPILIGGL